MQLDPEWASEKWHHIHHVSRRKDHLSLFLEKTRRADFPRSFILPIRTYSIGFYPNPLLPFCQLIITPIYPPTRSFQFLTGCCECEFTNPPILHFSIFTSVSSIYFISVWVFLFNLVAFRIHTFQFSRNDVNGDICVCEFAPTVHNTSAVNIQLQSTQR